MGVALQLVPRHQCHYLGVQFREAEQPWPPGVDVVALPPASPRGRRREGFGVTMRGGAVRPIADGQWLVYTRSLRAEGARGLPVDVLPSREALTVEYVVLGAGA
jgi:hypothetical protein